MLIIFVTLRTVIIFQILRTTPAGNYNSAKSKNDFEVKK